MERLNAASARDIPSAASMGHLPMDVRSASSGAITGKRASAPSTNYAQTVPGKASSPLPSTTSGPPTVVSTRTPRTAPRTPEMPAASLRSRRGPRQVYRTGLGVEGEDAADDNDDSSSDGVQYVVCQKQPAKPVLRNGRVSTSPPSASTSSSPQPAAASPDIIIAQGGPPHLSTGRHKSPTTIATPTSSVAGVTPTLSTRTQSSATVTRPPTNTSSATVGDTNVRAVASHTAAAPSATAAAASTKHNLLTPNAPQTSLRLPRASHADGDEHGQISLPSVLPGGSYSAIPEVNGTSRSVLESSTAMGTSQTYSILNNAHHSGSSGTSQGRLGTVTVSDAASGGSPQPRVPTRGSPSTGRSDPDAARWKAASPGSPALGPSKGDSRGVSPNGRQHGHANENTVVKLSASEEGTSKPISRASSRRNLFGSFRKATSTKDLATSTTSSHAQASTRAASSGTARPSSSTAHHATGRGDDARAPSGAWLYQHKPSGLHNFGATCYMNAALQCMMHTPNFLSRLERQHRRFQGFTNSEQENQGTKPNKAASRANSFRFKGKDKDDPIVSVAEASSGSNEQRKFTATIALTDLGLEKPHKSTKQLLQDVKAAAASYNEQFRSNGQNDAHEFLRTILYVVHDEVNQGQGHAAPYQELKDEDEETEAAAMLRWAERLKTIDNSVVYDLFGGVLQSTCECLTCGRLSRTFDPFLDLSIPVHSETPTSPAAPALGTPRTRQSESADPPKDAAAASKMGQGNAESLEDSGALASAAMVWESGGQGFAKPSSSPTAPAGLQSNLPTFSRDRNNSITRDELGSLCLRASNALIGSCSVDDIVSECFAQETQEYMTGDNRLTCERCKTSRDMVRRCKVSAWPKALVLHLKRFTGEGRKDFTKVTYPQSFTLTQNQTLLRYRLCGVVCHSGSERFGHYTAYVCVHKVPDDQLFHDASSPQATPSKADGAASATTPPTVVQRLHGQMETWYLCNDERITKVDTKEALSALENAYILFYHQV